MKNRPISRRTLLKGAGVAIGLPVLEAMLPRTALAAAGQGWPTRTAFFFLPNGVFLPDWKPTQAGADFELPVTLQAFESFRSKMTVLSGLALDAGRAHGDGGGDHARAAATFLTGIHPVKTAGSNIRAGVSVDQIIAAEIGKQTRFASLELGLEQGLNAGGCDTGYSCAYSSNVSWRTPTMPSAKETNPKLVFERLFGGDNSGESEQSRRLRERTRRSILDFVQDDARSLQRSVSGSDRRKLDEYMTGIREIELRLEHFANSPRVKRPHIDIPEEKPNDFVPHFRLMGDLLVLAFQSDLTRVASFMVGNAGSNRAYKMIGVAEGHHSLSHHGEDPAKIEQIKKINQFHAAQFAYVLGKLDSIKEGDGTLLDHSLIMYGSGLGDGNRHNHDDLPIVYFGSSGGAFKTGQHFTFDSETPLCNFYVTLLQRLNVPYEKFGDAQSPIDSLRV